MPVPNASTPKECRAQRVWSFSIPVLKIQVTKASRRLKSRRRLVHRSPAGVNSPVLHHKDKMFFSYCYCNHVPVCELGHVWQ